MIYFVIPLMSKKVAKDWNMVSTLFNRTLWSCYNQTDPDFRIIVACHEIPELTKKYDDRVEFIQVSEKDAPIPRDQHEKMVDKGYKTHTLAMRVRELGGGYAMMVDGDDLVSCHFAEFVKKHPGESGFYVKTGYVYFVGDDYMKVLPKFSSGSACIVNYAVDDLPDSYPEVMRENCDDEWCIMRKRHGGVVPACEGLGRPLKPLPFKGAVYVLGSGENHSLYGKTTKYQTRLRELRELFEFKHKIKGKLKREFSIDWL
ncbi:glycosyltransferase family 2 protein [Clostridium transplantifaecale]|uniref:glycosyltransferase family 2 protein n=1 Tax=Clostridium transplantifaecale TaxID=2479838 RepID=UPI000F642257|nr:glycosyltransferase family 2 protein [Clostridium transplantifaecale]